MRLHNCDTMLASLTDGQMWHTFKFEMTKNALNLLKYAVLSSTDERMLLGVIPNLLDL